MKKTIFVSSTYQDLASYRRAVWDLLEEFDVAIRGMEEFGARTGTPLETCLAEVEQSDIYIGIIGFRLGSVEESTQKSYTQLEYERALELEKEVLIYLIDEENARVPIKFIDRDIRRDKLEAFKRKLRDNHTVDTFVSEDDLVQKLRRDLRRYIGEGEPKEITEDEFAEARLAIDKFLLVPKAAAGREVRLEVQLKGKPFPASRELCTAFNFVFGATVGVPIAIVQPDGYNNSGLSQLFLTAKQLDDFLPVAEGESRHIYAKLQFADAEIPQMRTRFKPETTYVPPQIRAFGADLTSIQQHEFLYGKTIEHPAEGKIILSLTKSGAELDKRKSSA